MQIFGYPMVDNLRIWPKPLCLEWERWGCLKT